MIGYDIECKYLYSYDDTSLEKAYDCIQLTEFHEAGEIINDYWLITNCYFDKFEGKYDIGYYVRIIDIRYLEIFATDINYDDRKDLIKINIKKENRVINGETYTFDVNIYSVIN